MCRHRRWRPRKSHPRFARPSTCSRPAPACRQRPRLLQSTQTVSLLSIWSVTPSVSANVTATVSANALPSLRMSMPPFTATAPSNVFAPESVTVFAVVFVNPTLPARLADTVPCSSVGRRSHRQRATTAHRSIRQMRAPTDSLPPSAKAPPPDRFTVGVVPVSREAEPRVSVPPVISPSSPPPCR